MTSAATALVNRTLIAIGASPLIRAWRNNTGSAWMGKPERIARAGMVRVNPGDVVIRGARPVSFGLLGSGDIIGLRQIEITPGMVGQHVAQFVSVECKSGSGRQSEQQKRFQKMVTEMGGVYVVARDAEEAARGIAG